MRFLFWIALAGLVILLMGCAELLPPWPVVACLVVGLFAARFLSGRQAPRAALGTVLISVLLAAWMLWPSVSIRPANQGDPVHDTYFPSFGFEKSRFRNVVVASGTFTVNTNLTADLYHVKSGNVLELNGIHVGRSSSSIGGPAWLEMKFTLALADEETTGRRITRIASAGHRAGAGSNSGETNDVQALETRALGGTIRGGRKRIVYVEGDRGFCLERWMSVSDFAKANSGNYLVVLVGVE